MSTEIISANVVAVADGLPAERQGWPAAAIFTALAMASLDTAIANISRLIFMSTRPMSSGW
jgi:DHA2 family multidrug resistance protein-like MFS transporter